MSVTAFLPEFSSFMPAVNSTLLTMITPTASQPPFYHTTRPSLLSFVSDRYLALAMPNITYWLLSLVFHVLDTIQLPYFESKRLHDSPEVLSRNRVTMKEVVKAVIFQQVIQTILGLVWLEDDEVLLKRDHYRDHLGEMATLAPKVAGSMMLALGQRTAEDLLRNHGAAIVRWVYWWGIPTARILFAFFILDTWQYWMHRAFHTSRFLYRHFHSVHHRLYSPYAFGALYNHPLEGFIFDSLGSVVAENLAGLSIRQTTLFFGFSSMKTVDDHCGYRIWWDPLQWMFPNNADYHDIHHQAFGIKSNFSQPFFVSWDRLLGTEMTRAEADKKVRKVSKVEKIE